MLSKSVFLKMYLKNNHEVKLIFRGFRPNGRIIGTIYAIGIPSIIMQSIGSVMTYSMNRILIEFSSTATAVFGVYFKLQSFFFMPVFGLNNGITPIIAFNYGAQNRKRMIVSIMRQLIILVPAAYILSKLGGLHAVWWSFPIAEIVSLMVSLFFLFRINRTIISTIPDGSDIL